MLLIVEPSIQPEKNLLVATRHDVSQRRREGEKRGRQQRRRERKVEKKGRKEGEKKIKESERGRVT